MAQGTWIKSPRGTPAPGTCCECKPLICDPCAGCGTPEVCYTPITPGDSVVHCGQQVCAATPPPFGGTIATGNAATSRGIVKVCGTPSACTLRINFFNFGDFNTGNALGSRSIQILVDGVAMSLTYTQAFEVNEWAGSTIVTLGLGVCINVEYILGTTGPLDGFWVITITCIP